MIHSDREAGAISDPIASADSVRSELLNPRFDAVLSQKLIDRALVGMPPIMQQAEKPLAHWIANLLDEHRGSARSVASFGIRKLEFYFPSTFLNETKVVVVPQCPELPLKALGLSRIAMPAGPLVRGITFDDTYFVTAGSEHVDRLHFHEAIHAVQWKILGVSGFLFTYGAGLLPGGYDTNPLETMAYGLDALYEDGHKPFDAVMEVDRQLRKMTEE